MKDAYSYYIEPFENFDQVIAWESPADFGSGDFLDSSRLEVFARHRVLCRARVTILFGGLLGLNLAGLR